MTHFATAAHALAPIIIVGLAIFGLATLLTNGGVGWMILIDRIHLHRRARATGCTIDELIDGDDWARHNGYAPPKLEACAPRPAMPPSLAQHIAERLAADVDAEWAEICRATGGDAA